ncbi:hypothetical protein [Streptomyces sp. HPF1205]|uniref:hypothetical protein n=1 Tax=Streptomyces sp. HPF1205 TaxID=2873262 RepID=UPI001CED89FB|nr:hypothetical protein [Streptomyces sp. HPF1205]
MSRGGYVRNRRARRAPSGGLLAWALSLPARLHLRWLVIVLVTAAVMGAYGRVLLTAAPMPPSKAPTANTGTEQGPQPVSIPSPTSPTSPTSSPSPTATVTSEVG